MSDNDDDVMAEFAEFLKSKRENEAKAQAEEDFEVEVWDEKGRGVRTRRSHAKPFLQSLGIDVDPPADGKTSDKNGNDSGGNPPKSGRTSNPRQSASNATSGSVRKYFTKPGS